MSPDRVRPAGTTPTVSRLSRVVRVASRPEASALRIMSCTSMCTSLTGWVRALLAPAARRRASRAASMSSNTCPMRGRTRSTRVSPRVSILGRYGAVHTVTWRGSLIVSRWSPTLMVRRTSLVTVRCDDRPHSRATSSQFLRAHLRQPHRRHGPAMYLSKVNGFARDHHAPPTNGTSQAAAATHNPT